MGPMERKARRELAEIRIIQRMGWFRKLLYNIGESDPRPLAVCFMVIMFTVWLFLISGCVPFTRWLNHEHIPNRYQPTEHNSMILENDKK